jgi:hypothetical protein
MVPMRSKMVDSIAILERMGGRFALTVNTRSRRRQRFDVVAAEPRTTREFTSRRRKGVVIIELLPVLISMALLLQSSLLFGLPTVSAVSSRAFFHKSYYPSRGGYSLAAPTLPSLVPWSWYDSLRIGWPSPSSWFTRKKSFRRQLQDQISLLEKQLRASRDELYQVRSQLTLLQQESLRQQAGAAGGATATPRAPVVVTDSAILQEMRSRIQALEKDVATLHDLRDKLQELLQQEKMRVQELEERLKVAEESNQAATAEAALQQKEQSEQKYKAELQALETKWMNQVIQQMDQVERAMEQRLQQALERERAKAAVALKAAEEQLRQVRIKAELQVKQAISSTEQRVQKEAAKQLKAEKKLAKAAVELEKAKMRKLVKALALREEQQQQQQQQFKVKTSSTKNGSGATQPVVNRVIATSNARNSGGPPKRK